MVETSARPVLGSLSVGQAIGDTFRAIRQAWLSVFALSALVALASLPFAILYAQKLGPTMEWAKAGAKGAPPAMDLKALSAVVGGAYLLQIVVSLYAFAVSSAGIERTLRDGRFELGASLRDGAVRWLPLVVAAIGFYIVLTLGLMLFVVPGAIFGAAFGLAPTLCVTERRGPVASFSRSAELTRGSRWRCLAVTLILTIVPAVAVLVVDTLIVRSVGAQNNFIVSAVTNLVVLPIYYAFPAVLAHDLRLLREGGGPRGVADVF